MQFFPPPLSPVLRLAIDGGTTNTRAVLLRGAEVIAVARRSVGASDVAKGASARPLQQAIAECVAEALAAAGAEAASIRLICASGMLTSNVGLIELPHLKAPASCEDLAGAVETKRFPQISDLPIHFVRGVKVLPGAKDSFGSGDMMRGEECEVFGLLNLAGRRGPALLVLPGSHTKLVHVDAEDRIVDLQTSLAGEMIRSLSENTVLAGSVPHPLPQSLDVELVRRGAAWANERGLLAAAFQVRTSQILAGYRPEQCAALLVGMVVGSDVACIAKTVRTSSELPVLIGGPAPLRAVYADLLRQALPDGQGRTETATDSDVARAPAIGCCEIVELSKGQRGLPRELNI